MLSAILMRHQTGLPRQGYPLHLHLPHQTQTVQTSQNDSLRDERESLRADGRTRDKFDEDVAQGSREVGARDLLQHRTEGVNVGRLAGRVTRTGV